MSSFGESLVRTLYKIYGCTFTKIYRDEDIHGLCFVLEIKGEYRGVPEGGLQLRVFDEVALMDLMGLKVLDSIQDIDLEVFSSIYNIHVGGSTTEESMAVYSEKPFELYRIITEDIGMADYIDEILSLESTGRFKDGSYLESYDGSGDGVGYYLNNFDGKSSCFTLGSVLFYSVLEFRR